MSRRQGARRKRGAEISRTRAPARRGPRRAAPAGLHRRRLARRTPLWIRLQSGRRGSADRRGGAPALRALQRALGLRVSQLAAHRGGALGDDRRPAARRRLRRVAHLGRHREHLDDHAGGPRVGPAPGQARARRGDRAALRPPRVRQGGSLSGNPFDQDSARARSARRRRGDARGDHAVHRHAGRLRSRLSPWRDRSHRVDRRARPRALAALPRRRLSGRLHASLPGEERRADSTLRLPRPRRHLDVRRSAQVWICGQGSLGGDLPFQ